MGLYKHIQFEFKILDQHENYSKRFPGTQVNSAGIPFVYSSDYFRADRD
jgi:hypothetical protein